MGLFNQDVAKRISTSLGHGKLAIGVDFVIRKYREIKAIPEKKNASEARDTDSRCHALVVMILLPAASAG